MYQVHTGAYVSLLAPRKTDYNACHPRKTTMYILHAVPITTHTHDRRKSIKKRNKERKKIKGIKEKKAKNEKEKEKQEKQEKQENSRQKEEARKGKEIKRQTIRP